MNDSLTTRLRAAALTCLAALIVAGLSGCASHQLPASAKAATAGWIHGPLACPHCGSAEDCHCCRPHCWNQGYHCTTWSRLEPCFDQTMYLGAPQPAYPPQPTEELPPGNPFQDDMLDGTEMPDRLEPPTGAHMPGGPDMDTSRREPETDYLLDPYLQDVSFTTTGPQYRMGRLMRLPYVEPPKLRLESELPLQPAEPPELLSE